MKCTRSRLTRITFRICFHSICKLKSLLCACVRVFFIHCFSIAPFEVRTFEKCNFLCIHFHIDIEICRFESIQLRTPSTIDHEKRSKRDRMMASVIILIKWLEQRTNHIRQSIIYANFDLKRSIDHTQAFMWMTRIINNTRYKNQIGNPANR